MMMMIMHWISVHIPLSSGSLWCKLFFGRDKFLRLNSEKMASADRVQHLQKSRAFSVSVAFKALANTALQMFLKNLKISSCWKVCSLSTSRMINNLSHNHGLEDPGTNKAGNREIIIVFCPPTVERYSRSFTCTPASHCLEAKCRHTHFMIIA